MPINDAQRTCTGGHGNSRPDMDTEDNADGDVNMDRTGRASKASPSLELHVRHLSAQAHGAAGIVLDSLDDGLLEVNADAHIINDDSSSIIGGDGVGVEDGIVSLETNDDFAMGAPPGVPGAIVDEGGGGRRGMGGDGRGRMGNGPDVTPH